MPKLAENMFGDEGVADLDRTGMSDGEAETLIAELTGEMLAAAEALEFERAAMLRDRIRDLRKDPAGKR